MNIRRFKLRAGIFLSLLAALPLLAQVQQSLHDFTNTPDGASPGDMVLSSNVLYGACRDGGLFSNGTLFYLSTNGNTYVKIHDFAGAPTDGASPNNIIVNGGTIYGSTYSGSTNASSYGTVFKVGTNGLNYKILRSFTNPPDGSSPLSAMLLLGTNLYGATSTGGSNGCGLIFEMDTNGGSYRVLHTFTNTPDGNSPRAGLTLLGTNIFGTTASGGQYGQGTIFRLSTNGTGYTILHNFTNTPPDGEQPMATLTAVSNVLYGTSSLGGAHFGGMIFSITTNGVYTILTNLPAFNFSYMPLIFSGGQLYGGTYAGGAAGVGSLYQVSTNGSGYMVLKSFTNSPDGNGPKGTLILISSNLLFGTTYQGGITSNGLAFSLPLTGPVVTQQPQSVTVTNGSPASFSVAATGLGQLYYQWYFRTNTGITNAINTTVLITNCITNVIGTYSAVVTNIYGKTTSSYAALSVVAAPVVLSYSYNGGSGSFQLAMAETPGVTNRIWGSTNLISTNFWRVLATNVMATNGLWFFTDPATSRTNPMRFYRMSNP